MAHYVVEVRVREGEEHVWRPVRPTGGQPYTFPTGDEALQFARKWYPEQTSEDVRIAYREQ